jgi:TPR repeat protein
MVAYGFCLELGFGVDCNPGRAVELYRIAAESGDLHAMYRLALCLCDGVGSERNLREAISWLRQAAAHGYPDAQFDFAMCLEFGCGCPVNHRRSREWLELAAHGGNMNAQIVVMASPQNFSQSVQTKFRAWSSKLLAGRDLERERKRDPGCAEEMMYGVDINENELGSATGWTRFIVAAQQSS